MSNGGRPSAQRKVTRASKEKQAAALNEGLTITVDGKAYTVTAGDLTGLDTMALRKEVGLSFAGVLRAMQTDPDIDLIASIVWLARRIDGERTLTFAQVAEEIGYNTDFEMADPEEPEAGEASGGTS